MLSKGAINNSLHLGPCGICRGRDVGSGFIAAVDIFSIASVIGGGSYPSGTRVYG
jgi:hypothetical protein